MSTPTSITFSSIRPETCEEAHHQGCCFGHCEIPAFYLDGSYFAKIPAPAPARPGTDPWSIPTSVAYLVGSMRDL